MRIHALVARRNNGMTGQPTLRHNRRIDGGLEGFRSQARTVEIEVAIAPDLGSLERPDTGLEPQFCNAQRFSDVSDLVRGFGFSRSDNRIPFVLYGKALGSQLVGQQRGKIRRNDKGADAPFAYEQIEKI